MKPDKKPLNSWLQNLILISAAIHGRQACQGKTAHMQWQFTDFIKLCVAIKVYAWLIVHDSEIAHAGSYIAKNEKLRAQKLLTHKTKQAKENSVKHEHFILCVRDGSGILFIGGVPK